MKKKVIISAAAAFAFGVFSAYSAWQSFTVQRYDIDSDKIDLPVKILLISDLHSCFYGDGQRLLINAIDKENPDIIALSGDIFDDDNPDDGALVLLEHIGEKYPCFYVTGNHETYTGNTEGLKELARQTGVTVLSGEKALVDVKGQKIAIAGVDDVGVVGQSLWEAQLASVRGEKDSFSLLISHRPEFVDQYGKSGFDLILCGHAHGGQWRIPGILNGLYAPGQGVFPKYAGGEYKLENSTMIVGRGLERNFIPRYFNSPELVVITVK